jgi:hypothetical protein
MIASRCFHIARDARIRRRFSQSTRRHWAKSQPNLRLSSEPIFPDSSAESLLTALGPAVKTLASIPCPFNGGRYDFRLHSELQKAAPILCSRPRNLLDPALGFHNPQHPRIGKRQPDWPAGHLPDCTTISDSPRHFDGFGGSVINHRGLYRALLSLTHS